MIYFDNSATTTIHPEVIEAMRPYIEEHYGNPSGKYYTLAENAKKAVEQAREQVAQLFNCTPDEVIFTSGSTESNNFVLKGLADLNRGNRKQLITTKTEHSSIMETAKFLEERGITVRYLDVDRNGRINIDDLDQLLKESAVDTYLTSIMWGNNELGTLNEIEQIGNICAKYNIQFHSDATQIVGKIPIDLARTPVHFLSASGHKFHGPKGIGVCIIKKDELGLRKKITPLLHGGGQEFGYRSGTLAVHNIVGIGAAAEIAHRDLEAVYNHLWQLERYCRKRLYEMFPEVVNFNITDDNKIPGILSVRFTGVNNEILIKKLADQVALSTGSACSSSKPSYVLQSIGLGLDEVRSTVRISFSRFNTIEQIDDFIAFLSK